jgi:transposase
MNETNQKKSKLPPEERQRIIHLRQHGYGTREIARRTGRDRKAIRRVLQEEGLFQTVAAPPASSKLDPFRESIRDKVHKHLTVTRILREIRQLGYVGGRTILANYVRSTRTELAPRSRVKRRFETRPAQEMQVDWAVYRVPIATVLTTVHALVCELAYSRKAHVHFYRNERQPTLLEALTRAFEAFAGVTLRVVFDNMATIVLGRIGSNGKPIWHPRFIDFFKYYGFEAFLCKVRDPDRKGKDERFIHYLEEDYVRGSEFASFEELNQGVQVWLDTIANRRTHGTTGLIPDEAWLAERDFLIRLPETRFAVHEDSIRQVGPDATISVRGTLYTVPAVLANRSVAVRLYAEHFEVLNRAGSLVFSRSYVADRDKGKLQIDSNHYATLPRRQTNTHGTRIDQAFLQRFPSLAGLVEGIALRMKTLAPVHLRALWRLADLYGQEAFLRASRRAQDYRRFNAEAVRRILEHDNPIPEPPPVTPLSESARTLALLTEIEPCSLESYAHLDSAEASQSTPHEESGTQLENLAPAPEPDPNNTEDRHDT